MVYLCGAAWCWYTSIEGRIAMVTEDDASDSLVAGVDG